MNYYDLISLILTQLHERINSDEFLERKRLNFMYDRKNPRLLSSSRSTLTIHI